MAGDSCKYEYYQTIHCTICIVLLKVIIGKKFKYMLIYNILYICLVLMLCTISKTEIIYNSCIHMQYTEYYQWQTKVQTNKEV